MSRWWCRCSGCVVEDCELRRLVRSLLAPVCFRSSLAGQGACQLRWVSCRRRCWSRLVWSARFVSLTLLLGLPALVDTKDVAARKKDRQGWPPLSKQEAIRLPTSTLHSRIRWMTIARHCCCAAALAARRWSPAGLGQEGGCALSPSLKIDQSNPNAAVSPSPYPLLTKLATA